MLRVYQPITSHPIYTLHSQLEHLVCEVWCNANATPCENLLQPSFRIIYNAYSWLKTDIDTIYAKCVQTCNYINNSRTMNNEKKRDKI